MKLLGCEVFKPVGFLGLPGIGPSNNQIKSAETKLKILSVIEKVTQFSCLISGTVGVASAIGGAVYNFLESSTPVMVEGYKLVCENAEEFIGCQEMELVTTFASRVPYSEVLRHLPVVALATITFALITGLVAKVTDYLKNSILDQIQHANYGHLPGRLQVYR